MNKKVKHGTLLTVIFTVLSLLYLYPIVLVFINSFKKKAYISKAPFEIPTGKMYVGLENYIRGIKQTGLIQAFGWSLPPIRFGIKNTVRKILVPLIFFVKSIATANAKC